MVSDKRLKEEYVNPGLVSIPFLSGHGFRLEYGRGNRRVVNGLNPLPIGSWFPTGMGCGNGRVDRIVSIPFLSGHGFRPKKLVQSVITHNVVSIPFLSGHGFRPDIPLTRTLSLSASQSPSYRVMVSDSAWTHRRTTRRCGLNPLPIGSWFPTRSCLFAAAA